MQCAGCGTDLLPGKPFCPACGQRASVRCPSCGADIAAGFRFCPDCGARVLTEPPQLDNQPAGGDDRLRRLSRFIPAELAAKIDASRGLMAGERKLVTVLFCDLVGSTAIAERLDPEEYRDLLDEYLAVAFREIYTAEGIVNQLAGDGLMALFGAPVAHEDAPERAVVAALSIRAAIASLSDRLRREQDIALNLRIGIHTGPVVVGTIGNDRKMDYTAIGDTTNLAARLQSVAEPGTILVSEATRRLVLGRFRMREVGPFELKGKSEPVTAHEVLERRASATPMGIALARGLTPFVGRAEELEHLRTCYDRLGSHWAQVVAVVGDAGSGKSRLLYEFKQSLADQAVVFLEGRCSSLSQMVPYAAIVSMLRGYFGLGPDDGEQACAKIAAKLEAVDSSLCAAYPSLCRLLATPVADAAELPADERKRETFDAVGHLVSTASERMPVVMIIEDVHWIDAVSLELLQLAASRLQRVRVMLVVSHRADDEILWRTQAAFTRLSLRRLPDEAIVAMIRAVAGARLPRELEDRIVLKAEGNPFFAEELTRGLVEEGHIVTGDGAATVTRPLGEIAIPNTVQELIGARLDRLRPAAKRAVRVAAVLGRQFRRDQLAAVLDGEGIDIAGELDGLERLGIVHRKTVLSDAEFRFGESLTQEIAYEGLLLRERRQLHGRIAQLLQAAGEATAQHAALVAHHFARSDRADKAVPALLTAAREAEVLPSYATAVDLYRQAWELAEAILAEGRANAEARRWVLDATHGLARLTIIYGSSAATVDPERAARRGRELAEALDDRGSLAFLGSLLGLHIMGSARASFDQGLAMTEEALGIALEAELVKPAISVARGLALAYVLDGRFADARAKIDWVMGELERSGDRARLADVYFGGCWVRDTVRLYSDDLGGARAGAEETYALAVKAHNQTAQAGMAAKLCQLHLTRGDYAAAKEWAERCLALAEQIANVPAILTAGAVMLSARSALGEPASRYIGLVDHAVGAGNHLLLNARVVVDGFLAVGELNRAQKAAELAQSRAGGRLREALTASALGDVLRARGPADFEAAETTYRRAVDVAEAIGARSVAIAARLGLAALELARGTPGAAAARLDELLATCRSLDLGRDASRAEQLLAHRDGGARAPVHSH
jgi:class 3 adenylate cyclase/tetratricopeptide (TPR) repeat protein